MRSGTTPDGSVADGARGRGGVPGTTPDGAERGSQPPVAEALQSMSELVGRKWHPVVLYHLQTVDRCGFAELEERIGGISSKVLSETLSELMAWDAVQRRIVQERPVRVAYSLTPEGRELEPLLAAMEEWGRAHAVDRESDE